MRKWTLQEIETLRILYQTKTRAQISAIMGIPLQSVTGALKRNGILSGRITTFKEKNKPWNKDLSVRTNPASEFKQGNEPHNTLYDGAIRLRSNRYYYIRLAKGVWKLYSRHVWEKQNGPIPAGMYITFMDGNPLNCHISNLQLSSQIQMMVNNQNRKKSATTLKTLYKRERLRKKYGLTPLSGHGPRLTNIYQ